MLIVDAMLFHFDFFFFAYCRYAFAALLRHAAAAADVATC